MARLIIMITSLLYKTRELRLRIFKCRDVIWIVMELSFMLLQWFISSWFNLYSYFTVSNATMQYNRNVLFNTHCHVVDLILTVGINHH